MSNNVWLDRSERGSGFTDCGSCGASVAWKNRIQHENFHKTFGHRRETVSNVKWCDSGNHAFKAGVDGSASFEGVNYVDGKPVSATQDVCPKHNPYNVTVDIENAVNKQLTNGE
jgi:hypothetical protein